MKTLEKKEIQSVQSVDMNSIYKRAKYWRFNGPKDLLYLKHLSPLYNASQAKDLEEVI